MIKRASTILLTLFLLLTSAQVWAETSSTTTFQKKDGVTGTYYKLDDIKITPPFISSITTSYEYNASASGALDKYKVTGSGAQFSYSQSSTTQSNFVSINFANLKKNTSYTFEIKLNINGSTHDGLQLTYNLSGATVTNISTTGCGEKGNSLSDKWFKIKQCNSDATFKYTFTANSTSATYSLKWDWTGKSINYALIKSATITGAVDPLISSENGDNICKGESNTFTTIGVSSPITWTLTDKNGNTTTLPGNGTSITLENIQQDGTIKANSLSYKFKAIVCCNTQADRIVVHHQPFNMPNTTVTQCDVSDLVDEDGNSISFTSSYCYGYFKTSCKCPNEDRSEIKNVTNNFTRNVTTLPDECGPVEEHFVIAKTTKNMFHGWWKKNGDKNSSDTPIRGHTGSPADRDGFMVINCGRLAYDETRANPSSGKIFEYEVNNGICTNTWYNFAAMICNIDQTPNHTFNPNVRFVVYGINPNGTIGDELLNQESGTIQSRAKWEEAGGSFNSYGYTKLLLILYNNQVPDNVDACDIAGNDIGIDDIKFTRCIPHISPYFDVDRTNKYTQVCNDGSESVTIYAGHPSYGITDMIDSPSYALLQSKNGGNWELVEKITDYIDYGYGVFNVDIEHNQPDTKYTVFVASSESLVDEIVNHFKNTSPANYVTLKNNFTPTNLGCNLYAIGDYFATAEMDCPNPCTSVAKPTTQDFTSCKTPGTKSFYDLLVNPKFAADKYVWEKVGSTAPVPATFSTDDLASSGTYKVKSIKHTHTDGIEYCESGESEVKVTIDTNVPIVLLANGNTYGPTDTYTICAGTTVQLVAQVDASYNVDWTATPADPNTDVTTIHTQNITVTPADKTTYTANAIGSCYLEGTITVDLTTAKKPVLQADNQSICLGSPIKITDTITETALDYEWSVKKDNGTWTTISNTSKNLDSYTPDTEGTYSFKSKAKNGECEAESDPITVTVGAPITFVISEPVTICEGANTTVSVTNINPTTAHSQWYDENDNKIGDVDELRSVSVSPEETTTYKVSLWVDGGCTANGSVTITVDGRIEADIMEDQDICLEKSATIWASGGDVKWYIDAQEIGAGESIIVTPTSTTKYTAKIAKGVCTKDTFMVVNVHELPEIISIEKVDPNDNKNSSMKATVSHGTEPYEYSLNGEDFAEIPNGILENLPIGWNLLYVKDKYGCENQKMFKVDPLPINPDKYFSPNEDGVHDLWQVENLNIYSSYIVEIFDRYGKRLFIQRVGSFNTGEQNSVDGDEFKGWDGFYNEKPMVSDDYWYLITVEDIRKQYTGHFTLKR